MIDDGERVLSENTSVRGRVHLNGLAKFYDFRCLSKAEVVMRLTRALRSETYPAELARPLTCIA